MIHIAETVGVGSIENFVDPSELKQLATWMAEHLARQDDALAHYDRSRTASIHEIPGHTTTQAMAVYEPRGRIEITDVPAQAEQLLQLAFERSRPALGRLMPSINVCRPWTYVEYGSGQHITSHLDGIAPDPYAWPRQIAGISVVLSPADQGGGFYVETSASEELWMASAERAQEHGYAEGMWLAHDGADNSSAWFQQMPRTRWTVNPASGTALLYGSQLAHGTEPVVQGRAAKFISWLAADSTEPR